LKGVYFDEGFYFNLPVARGADGSIREMINLGQFLGAVKILGF
jgi:hypothetical protein